MLGRKDIVGFIPTTDKLKARAFYEEILGLEFKEDAHFAVVMNVNGIDFWVVSVGEFTPLPFTILGWAVQDIEASVNSMRAKGVDFEVYDFLPHDELGIWTAPDGARVAWFKDPDGNTLSVSQDMD